MPYNVKHNQKALALELRRNGLSYAEIQREIVIPKSTLAGWIKDVRLTKKQKERLAEKQKSVARKNARKRILEVRKTHQEIADQAARDVQKISKRELWLLGIMLYGKECWSAKSGGVKTSVQFASTDDFQIQLFLKWLRDVGNIKGREISCDIILSGGAERESSVNHWVRVTGFPEEFFSRIHGKGNSRQPRNKFGQLRVRVNASSLLARQIAGWMRGVEKCIKDL